MGKLFVPAQGKGADEWRCVLIPKTLARNRTSRGCLIISPGELERV